MLLLFDAKHQYLGEVTLSEEGALKSIILTKRGDDELGPMAALWQTKGIPVKQKLGGLKSVSDDETFYVERVQPRQNGFKQAFLSWADEAKIAVIELPDKVMGFWEALLRLPLTASERFTYLLGICRTPEDKLKEWEKLFNKFRYDESSAQSKRALNQLKVKLAKEMTSSFCDVK